MRKRLLVLVLSLLLLIAASVRAQPLTATAACKVTFTPVLIPEIADEGHEEGNVVYGPTVRFRLGYKAVSPN